MIITSFAMVIGLLAVFLFLVWPDNSHVRPEIPVWFVAWGIFSVTTGLGVLGLASWALFTFATNYKG